MLIEGKFYSDPELTSYIKKLKNTIAMNEESQKIADGVIEQLKQENAELKKTTEFLRSTLGKSNDKVIKLKAERDEMESENERLKLMLKTVADDIEKFRLPMTERCRISCTECLFQYYGRDNQEYKCCRYKRIGEINKLIGE